MSLPFFTVIVPTKNRSLILAQAIQSVLSQTVSDFELLVVDNDDDQEATRNLVLEYTDARVRYFRTGDLSMPDNWEYGFAQARGEYVLMLQDKSVLKFHALERLREVVASRHCEAVSWLQDIFNDLETPPRVVQEPATGQVRRISSKDVLETFLTKSRSEAGRVLPRGLNSCIHRSLIETIRNGPAARLFLPTSPDYTFSFLQLRHTDSIVHVDETLTIYGSCRVGQGRKSIYKEDRPAELVRDFGHGDSEFFNKTPIKARLLTSGIYNDYLKVTDLVGGRLAECPLHLPNYFVEADRDIEAGTRLGLDMSGERAAWWAAYRLQEPAVQREVQRVLNPPKSALKSVARALGLNYLRHRARRVSKDPPRLPTFPTALDYARWLAEQPLLD
jgi:hypothetical protein